MVNPALLIESGKQVHAQEGINAEVVKEITITSPTNPNKWGKTLAPWFTEDCREAKRNMAKARR